MKNINYYNLSTGEVTENHDLAMAWYREGTEIALIDYSECLGRWIERLRWVH